MAWFQMSFFSECLSRSVPVNVLLPADMFGPPDLIARPEKYKTLYLLHGYFGNHSDWLLNARVQEMSVQFNLAIVMMSGSNGFYVDQPKSGIRGSEFIGRELVMFTRNNLPAVGTPRGHDHRRTVHGRLWGCLQRAEVQRGFGHIIS
jgi:hypothetical protein